MHRVFCFYFLPKCADTLVNEIDKTK